MKYYENIGEYGLMVYESAKEVQCDIRSEARDTVGAIKFLNRVNNVEELEVDANDVLWEMFHDGTSSFFLATVIKAVEKHAQLLTGKPYKLHLVGDWVYLMTAGSYRRFNRDAIMCIWE
jgi:hypothetical protein